MLKKIHNFKSVLVYTVCHLKRAFIHSLNNGMGLSPQVSKSCMSLLYRKGEVRFGYRKVYTMIKRLLLLESKVTLCLLSSRLLILFKIKFVLYKLDQKVLSDVSFSHTLFQHSICYLHIIYISFWENISEHTRLSQMNTIKNLIRTQYHTNMLKVSRLPGEEQSNLALLFGKGVVILSSLQQNGCILNIS